MKPLTVGELKELLKNMPDTMWVCNKNGGITAVHIELKAKEPFCVLLGRGDDEPQLERT